MSTKALILLFSALALSGCTANIRTPIVEARPEQRPPPILIPSSPEQLAAERDYDTCLRRAARFAEGRVSTSGDLALVIAPLCYPQFSVFEAAMAESVSGEDRRAYERGSDKRQLKFAGDAVRQSREQAISASR
jgi:hypothetical protein